MTLRASYQQPLAFPLSYWISGDPSLFQRPHCPSCHCHLTAALYMPLGQTPLPVSPHWQHTQGSRPRSLTWRNHPLHHNSNQLPSGETSSLAGAAWKPRGTVFSSCCTLTHHSLSWGAPPLIGFKFFGGKDSIKIIFIDLLFCTSKKIRLTH